MTSNEHTVVERRSLEGQMLQILQHVEAIVEKRISKLELQISSLADTVTTFVDEYKGHEAPCPHLKEAIYNEDYKGHNDWHRDNKTWQEHLAEIGWAAVKTVAITLILGFMAWVGKAIWLNFLVEVAGK